LTGGVYSQSQDDIDYLMPRMQCGNIYINRPNTGARVGIEPFGGFKMSGTGPKAGGKDYLKAFCRLDKEQIIEEHGKVFELQSTDRLGAMVLSSQRGWKQRYQILHDLLPLIEKDIDQYLSVKTLGDDSFWHSLKEFFLNPQQQIHKLEFPNRYIPGQLSYDKKDMGSESVLMLTVQSALTADQLVYFLMNLLIGNGQTIACGNKQIASLWKKLVAQAYKVGFAIEDVQALHTTPSMVKQLFEREFSIVLLDPGLKELDEMVKQGLCNRFERFLRKIIICGEKTQMGEWYDYYDQLTLTRSYAINTMRHGAPLELSL